jgi:hypothetical protein
VDTQPDYDEITPRAAAAATWTFTAVYLIEDIEVGQTSQPASICLGPVNRNDDLGTKEEPTL